MFGIEPDLARGAKVLHRPGRALCSVSPEQLWSPSPSFGETFNPMWDRRPHACAPKFKQDVAGLDRARGVGEEFCLVRRDAMDRL